MKPLLRLVTALSAAFLLVAAVPAAEPVFPRPTGFVNDYAGLLDAQAEAKLEGLCRELAEKTSAQLAVAIVKSVEPLDPKTYAVRLFEQWRPGQKGKDNGLLILLAKDERRIEIEVGYGLEGVINDAKAGAILDKFGIPYFKAGQFGEGLYNVAAALSEQIAAGAKQEMGEQYRPARKTSRDDWGSNDAVISAAVLIIAVFTIFLHGLLAGIAGALIGALFGFFLGGPGGAALGAVLGFMVSYLRFFRGGWGGWIGGSFSGGGFGGGGGGFGGFGGGSSGGGGAGRSW
ncbi:MAG: TPM domain-containing protein [Candidatus Saganbacteria bacterium]|nr:TPM domain-containing protein [Candidatus Saganbacteria bacterium]